MQKQQIIDTFVPILWDYSVDPLEFYEAAAGRNDKAGPFDQERALIRCLERLSWYDLLKIFGIDFLKTHLTKTLISKLRFQQMRDKYEFLRKVLQGEDVSFSGWNSETRDRIEHTLLSNRWYRA